MRVLEIDGLKVSFRMPHGDMKAVDGATFSVAPGQTTALVGESGSGKSVIAQAIMGLLPHNAAIGGGSIRFRDPKTPDKPVDLAQLPAGSAMWRQLRGGRIGLVFQEPMTALSPLHTIGDQIREVWRLHNRHGDASDAEFEARAMLERIGFPDPDGAMNRYPFELSGGLRQRAVIAMALICRPALLIADEPTTALDVTLQAQILKLLRDLQAELDIAVLFITHDLGVVANIADDMAVMFRGRIMERGRTAALLAEPRHPYLKALMAAVPDISAGPPKRLTPLREVTARTADDFIRRHVSARRSTDDQSRPLLSARGLVKSYPLRRSQAGTPDGPALAGIDLDIFCSECLGLVGESGSGKSTAAKLLVRAFRPDLGSVWAREGNQYEDVMAMGPAALKKHRRRVQYVFQDPFASLNPRMTVFDILREPLVIHRACSGAEQRRYINDLISLVGLDPRHLNRYPHSFSGGQRQRIGIARALALQPDLLLLDEPVSALDVSVQAQILNLLKDLKTALNLTFLFVSHNLAVIDYMADRVAVMCRGRIVELASRDSLFARPRHPYTKALLDAVPHVAPQARLDLTALMNGRASEPSCWPAPFDLQPGEPATMVEARPGHWLGVAWRHRQASLVDCA